MHSFVTSLAAPALLALLLSGPAAHAQTKPRVLDAGATPPKTVMYVGNSFFYYNNGISSQVAAMATAADASNRAAATIYAALYGKSPLGSPHPETVDAASAKFLQQVAWETVREYYAK